MSAKFKIMAFLAVFTLIGLITAYVFEFKWLGNTFEVKKLVWMSILTGVLAGAVAGWRLQKSAEDLVSRMRIWATCLLLPALFAPLGGSLVNRLLTPYPVMMKSFAFF